MLLPFLLLVPDTFLKLQLEKDPGQVCHCGKILDSTRTRAGQQHKCGQTLKPHGVLLHFFLNSPIYRNFDQSKEVSKILHSYASNQRFLP